MATGKHQAVALIWIKLKCSQMGFRMFWIGLTIGLFVGANAGFLIAGMLISAKIKDSAQNRIMDNVKIDGETSSNKNAGRDSYRPLYDS
jgi:hypothetical protein